MHLFVAMPCKHIEIRLHCSLFQSVYCCSGTLSTMGYRVAKFTASSIEIRYVYQSVFGQHIKMQLLLL